MINPRFQPGGDKYDECMKDDRRAFYEKVQAEQSEIISALKTAVSTWTENEYEAGNVDGYMVDRFVDEYPEWGHDNLRLTIYEEIERVLAICELSGVGEAVQGA